MNLTHRPSGVRYLVLAVACSLALLAYVHRLAFAAAGPEIKKDLALNDQDMGYLMAAFLIAYGGFQVPGGWLGDRLGARYLLTLVVCGWSVATGAVALVWPQPEAPLAVLAAMIALRFCFGAFQAGAFPPLTRVVADWMPVPQRGFAQGMIWTFSRLGGAVIPLILIWLLYVYGGWRVPFLLLAGVGLLWCVGFWPWFRNRPEEMPAVNAAERDLIAAGRGAGLQPATPTPVPWRQMLASPSVWGLCLMYGCGGMVGNFFVTLLPIYLQDHRHLPPDVAKTVSGVPLAVGAVACLLGGVVSDWIIRATGNRKWGRRLTGSVGMTCAGLCLASTLLAEQTWLLAVLLAATFFFNDVSMGPAWAACADIGERHAGTLSGAMNMTGNLAGAGGAALAGFLLYRHQYATLFLLFGGVYWLGALCWLLVDGTRRLTAPAGVDSSGEGE